MSRSKNHSLGNQPGVDIGSAAKAEVSARDRYGVRVVILCAVWIGTIAGAAELLFLQILKTTSTAVPGAAGPSLGWQSGHLWLSRHIVWMTPTLEVVQLVAVGLILVLIARIKRTGLTLSQIVTPMTFVAAMSLLLVYQRLLEIAVFVLAAGIAFQAGRVAKSRATALLVIVRRSAPMMAIALLMLTVGTGATFFVKERISIARLPTLSEQNPNILLLILDTVRASNTSIHGYNRETTPNLERLATTGVVFDRAIATSPWTLPSHVSMMTGRLPNDVSASFIAPYEGEFPTLAEVLTARGYATAGFVSNVMYCGRESGLARGFQHYEDYPVSMPELAMGTGLGRRIVHSRLVRRLTGFYDVFGRKSAQAVTQDFLRWVDRRPASRPFFAFLNFNDAHDPYFPPEPFDTMFGTDFERRTDQYTYQMRRAPRTNRRGMTDEEIQAEIDAYDGAITYVDQQIGVLLEDLGKRGVLDNTIIVVAGDHGEQFGEHGLHEHGNSVFIQVLHVPMVVSFHGRTPQGTRVSEPVSIADIPATIMSFLDSGNNGGFPGTPLVRFWTEPMTPDTLATNDLVISEFTEIRENGKAESLVYDKYHYFVGWGEASVKDPRTGREMTRPMRFESLFDLHSDPEELRNLVTLDPFENLSGDYADLVEEMRELMFPHLRADPKVWEVIPPWAPERQALEELTTRQN